MTKKLWRAIAVFSFLGMIATAYLTYQHFSAPGEAFCNVNYYLSCDIVNKSIYAEIFGIPVAIIGFAAYAFFFFLSFLSLPGKRAARIGALVAGCGLLFSLYLTYIEFFVLQAVCIFCVTQQILILLIFIMFLFLW